MILTEFLEENAKRFPQKPSLIMRFGFRTLSLNYKEVFEYSSKIARFLEKNGVERGDKVLLLAPNSPYWICLFWGVLLRGGILVPLNIQSPVELVKKVRERTEAKILFKYKGFQGNFPSNLKVFDIEFLKEEIESIDISGFIPEKMFEDDVAEIMYTSGTTGDPKGVILTHKNIYSNLDAVSRRIPISPADKFLSILPLSHIFEQAVGFLLPFKNAAMIVYAHSPAFIRELLKEHRITKLAAVPEFLKIVMSRIEAGAREKGRGETFEKMLKVASRIKLKAVRRFLFHSLHREFGGRLRTVASGGAPLDSELEKKWEALGMELLQGYGLTETSPIVSCNTYDEKRRGSVGKILPGVRVKIAADGEILVKGSGVFKGYFKNDSKTKEVFDSEGWFMTGDIGELDKDGFLYIKGRKKYMILGPGGENVFPEDIEFELNKILGVKDSAVVGLEKTSGQVEIHAVLLGEIKDPEKIIAQANRKLAAYQQINAWSIWPEEDFPRSATRKVKKEEVLSWLRLKKSPTLREARGQEVSGIMKLLSEVTETAFSQIKSSTKMRELGLDSLLRVELVSRLEEKFGVLVREAEITGETTVEELEKMVGKGDRTHPKFKFNSWPLSSFVSWDRKLDQKLFIFPLSRIFVDLKVSGLENLQKLPGPFVFMPNHVSYLDSIVLAMALPENFRRKLAFAAAQDFVFRHRFLGFGVEWLFNAFPFPRQEGEDIKSGLEYMGKLLDKNWSVVVYPEGRISETGKLLPLKRGAGLIASEMEVPVVAVKIIGTDTVLPYGKIVPRKRGQVIVKVKFSEPLKFGRRYSYDEARARVQRIMERL